KASRQSSQPSFLLAPGVDLCDRVIPHGSHCNACQGCCDPLRLVLEQVRSDTDVCQCADATRKGEAHQAAQPSPAAQSTVAVRQQVVQPVVEYHRGDGCGALSERESCVHAFVQQSQYAHVHEHACATH